MQELTPQEIEERRLYIEKVLFTDSIEQALLAAPKEEHQAMGEQIYHQTVLAMMQLPDDVLLNLLDHPPSGNTVVWDTGARDNLIKGLGLLRKINKNKDITKSIQLEAV